MKASDAHELAQKQFLAMIQGQADNVFVKVIRAIESRAETGHISLEFKLNIKSDHFADIVTSLMNMLKRDGYESEITHKSTMLYITW